MVHNGSSEGRFVNPKDSIDKLLSQLKSYVQYNFFLAKFSDVLPENLDSEQDKKNFLRNTVSSLEVWDGLQIAQIRSFGMLSDSELINRLNDLIKHPDVKDIFEFKAENNQYFVVFHNPLNPDDEFKYQFSDKVIQELFDVAKQTEQAILSEKEDSVFLSSDPYQNAVTNYEEVLNQFTYDLAQYITASFSPDEKLRKELKDIRKQETKVSGNERSIEEDSDKADIKCLNKFLEKKKLSKELLDILSQTFDKNFKEAETKFVPDKYIPGHFKVQVVCTDENNNKFDVLSADFTSWFRDIQLTLDQFIENGEVPFAIHTFNKQNYPSIDETKRLNTLQKEIPGVSFEKGILVISDASKIEDKTIFQYNPAIRKVIIGPNIKAEDIPSFEGCENLRQLYVAPGNNVRIAAEIGDRLPDVLKFCFNLKNLYVNGMEYNPNKIHEANRIAVEFEFNSFLKQKEAVQKTFINNHNINLDERSKTLIISGPVVIPPEVFSGYALPNGYHAKTDNGLTTNKKSCILPIQDIVIEADAKGNLPKFNGSMFSHSHPFRGSIHINIPESVDKDKSKIPLSYLKEVLKACNASPNTVVTISGQGRVSEQSMKKALENQIETVSTTSSMFSFNSTDISTLNGAEIEKLIFHPPVDSGFVQTGIDSMQTDIDGIGKPEKQIPIYNDLGVDITSKVQDSQFKNPHGIDYGSFIGM